MNRKKQIRRRSYTLVEILMVLGLLVLVFGIGSASISAITGKRGLNGAVSIVSSQVNLARSVAVSQNRLVALILPDPSSHTTSTSNLFPFFCNRMRLCFVEKTSQSPVEYTWAGWIEGYDWVGLPARTCANFITGEDKAAFATGTDYSTQSIQNVQIFSSGAQNCTGIVFSPNGRLSENDDVMIQVYTAVPNAKNDGDPDMKDLGVTNWSKTQSTSPGNRINTSKLAFHRWCIKINKFTGRTRISYAQPEAE